MKTFAVYFNHRAHHTDACACTSAAAEPQWCFLPDSATFRSGNPFFIPDFATNFEARPCVALRLTRLGKSVAPRFAARYITEAAPAVCMVAADLLASLRAEGLPWSRAVAFDRSLLLGDFVALDGADLQSLAMTLTIGEEKKSWQAANMLLPAAESLSLTSRDNTVKTGDLLLPAVSDSGITLRQDTRLTASLAVGADTYNDLLTINIK